ncbi:hypothetical protein [Methylorubrum extorquens]|uniref:hypothetical protein n=1 Tax=Methylorubrum extorquens TaxID=408 RepID=UPI0012DB1DA4|nr:hypothetical protein [Methylorubrum extorquens]
MLAPSWVFQDESIEFALSREDTMRHHGLFDPSVDPRIPGGLTQAHEEKLKALGFEEGIVDKEVADAVVVFKGGDLPDAVELRQVTIPVGTRYLANMESGKVFLADCGNETEIIHIGK